MVSGDTPVVAATVNVYVFSAVSWVALLSLTSAVIEYVPEVLGVPEIKPPAVIVNPPGSLPAAMFQV